MDKAAWKSLLGWIAHLSATVLIALLVVACLPGLAFAQDTAPPTFVSGPTANPGGWTNADTITITWTATDDTTPEAVTAEYRIDSSEDLDFTPDDGPLVLDIVSLGLLDGKHTVDIRITDAAGNPAVASVDIYVDRTAPSPFTATANPATWTKGPVMIAFETTDPGAEDMPQTGSGIDYYSVTVDGIGDQGEQFGAFPLDTTAYPSGIYTVRVTAHDIAGNTTTSSVNVQVDNDPPAAFDATPDTTDWTKNDVSVSFLTFDPLLGSGIVDHYEVSIDGGPYVPCTSPYTMTLEGPRTLVIRALDSAAPEANIRECNAPITTLIDKTPPQLDGFFGWGDSGGGQIPIDYTVSDALSGVKTVSLWYKKGADGTWTDSGLNSATTSGTFFFQSVGDATYYFGFVIEDVAGNVLSSASGDGVFNTAVDTEQPTFSNIVATPHFARTGTKVTITFTVSEQLLVDPYVGVGLDDADFVSSSGLDYTFEYTVSETAEEGPADIYIEGIDLAYNYNWIDNFDQLTIDNTPPEDFTPIASPAGWTNASTIQVTFETTDALSGIDFYEVAIDDGPYSLEVSPYTVDTSALNDGVHTVHVKAVDLAGNERIKDVEIRIDRTPPAAFVPIVTPANWTGLTTAVVSWSASDAASGIDFCEVALDDGPYSVQASPYTINVAGLAEGTHTVHVRATDLVGNTTVASATAQVTAGSGPTAALTFTDPMPTLGRQFDYIFWKNWMGVKSSTQNTYKINWTASGTGKKLANVYVECRPDEASDWTLLKSSTAGSGTVSFDVSQMPESDCYQFRIRAVDAEGVWNTVVYDKFAVYDATRLRPTTEIITAQDGATLCAGQCFSAQVQVSLPVFNDPRAEGRAYKADAVDWWFSGHKLSATPKLNYYKAKEGGVPTKLLGTLLNSIPRQMSMVVAGEEPDAGPYMGRTVINTWQADYVIGNGNPKAQTCQLEMKYADVVTIGGVRQPDKPVELPARLNVEPLFKTLSCYEYVRFFLE